MLVLTDFHFLFAEIVAHCVNYVFLVVLTVSDGSFSVEQFSIFCGTETTKVFLFLGTSVKQSSFSTPGVSPNNFEPLHGKTVDLGNRLSLIASV